MNAVLLLALSLIPAAVFGVAPKPSAVVFTDVKLDDKLTVHSLRSSEKYERVYVVLSGITNVDAAHTDILDFMSKMDQASPGPRSELVVLAGENIRISDALGPNYPAPHEVNFIGVPTPVERKFASVVDSLFTDETEIDIFQIAPTPADHIRLLAGAPHAHVTLYHLVHGYNSQQLDEEGQQKGGAQTKFLQEIGDQIRALHPEALVVFTNNHTSFGKNAKGKPNNGGSQLFAAVNGRLPEAHLAAALSDTFHSKKLQQTEKLLKELKVMNLVRSLDGKAATKTVREVAKKLLKAAAEGTSIADNVLSETLVKTLAEHQISVASEPDVAEPTVAGLCTELRAIQNQPNSVPLMPTGPDFQGRELFDLVLEARKGEAARNPEQASRLRVHFLKYVDAFLGVVNDLAKDVDAASPDQEPALTRDDGKMIFRVRTAVRSSFIEKLSVELCDANHVAAVQQMMKEQPRMLRAVKVVYNPNSQFDEFRGGDHTLVNLSLAKCLELLEPYFLPAVSIN